MAVEVRLEWQGADGYQRRGVPGMAWWGWLGVAGTGEGREVSQGDAGTGKATPGL